MSRFRLLLVLLLSCAQPGESVGTVQQAVVTRVATDPVRPLAGQPQIDNGGNATYTIPLTVPPGRRGVAPELSLTYSSGGGESYLGLGFDLAGVRSSVRRCPKSAAYDGAVDGVHFDDRDRLCLDGQRLVGNLGAAYWDTGATYQQDLDAWRRVRHEGGANRTFVVELRDGGRKIYGGPNATVWATRSDRDATGALTNTSMVEVEWPLWKVEDRFGNYVELVYEHFDYPDGAYEHRLASILYTGGPGTTAERELQFVYVAQFEARSYFFRGTERRMTGVLDELIANVRLSQVRKYDLEYVADAWTGRPVLDSVTECGPLNRCRPPTTFEWSSPSFATTTAELMPVPDQWFDGRVWTQSLETGDVDGDSNDDVVYFEDGGANLKLYTRSRTASGTWTAAVDLGYELPYLLPPPRFFEVVPSQHGTGAQVLLRQLGGSGNSDSTWDVMRYQAGSLIVEKENVLGCVHNATEWWSPGIFTADLNGDGGLDFSGACATGSGPTPIVTWHRSEFVPKNYWEGTDPYESDPVVVGPQYARQLPLDFDGDRRAEVLSVPTPQPLLQETESPPTSGLVAVADVGTPMGDLPPLFLPTDEEYAFADLNGDGLTDAISFATDGMHLRLNTGRGFGPRTDAFASPPSWDAWLQYVHGGDVRVADFDRDGRQDVLIPVADPYTSNSTTFVLCRWVNGYLVPHEVSTPDWRFLIDWCVDPSCTEIDFAFQWHFFQVLDDDGDGDLSFTQVVEDGPDLVIETVEIGVTERPAVLARVSDNLSNPEFSYSDLSEVLLPEPVLLAPPVACPVPTEGPVPPCDPGAPLPDLSSCDNDYPNVCSERGWVADRVTLSNGQSTYPIRRQYSPRLVDLRRGGALGFQVIEEDELTVGAPRHSETRFDLAYADTLDAFDDIIDRRSPYAGVPSQVDSYQWPDASGINETNWPPSARKVIATRTVWRRELQESTIVAGAYRRLMTWRDTQVFEPSTHQLFQNTLEEADLIYHWRNAYVPDSWGNNELSYFYDVLGGDTETFTEETYLNDVGNYRIGLLQTRDVESIEGTTSRTRHYEYEYLNGHLDAVYNERGSSDEARVEYDYDAWGNVERIDRYATNPEFGEPGEPAELQRFDLFRYDSVEHIDMEEQENALGHITEFEVWTDTGDTYLVRDPNGIEQTFTYDGFSNVLEHEHDGVVDTFEWTTLSSGGCYELDVDPDGQPRTVTVFDCFGRALSITDTHGADSVRGYKYDEAGRLVFDGRPRFLSDPEFHITLEYDGLGRLTGRKLPTGEVETWSYVGRELQHGNLQGGIEWVRRDTVARVREHQIDVGPGEPEDRAVYQYGAFGVLETVSHMGFDTTFDHDIYGHIDHIDHPDSGDRWMTRNAFGELENTTFGDGTVRNTEYDVLGRVSSIIEPGNTVDYLYDAGTNGVGRLTSASRDAAIDVQTSFVYADPFGRLTTTTTTVDGEPFVQDRTYEGIHVDTVTYQAVGLTAPVVLEYNRDSAGRLNSVIGSSGSWMDGLWGNHERDASRRSIDQNHGPVQLQRLYFDASGLLEASLATLGSTTIDAHQYAYTNGDYLHTDTDQIAGVIYAHDYDDRGRLTELRLNGVPAINYDYDEFGNQTDGVNNRTFHNDGRPHTLDTADGDTFTHDIRGRRVARSDGWQAAYTAFDLPQWIMQPGGDTTTYAYDAFERRAYEVEGTTETIELGDYLRVTKFGKHLTRIRVQAEGELIAELQDDGRRGIRVHWQVESPLGTSSTSVFGSSVTHHERPEPFGATSGLPGDGLRFAGHDYESAGRLVNAKGRMYDPSNATFLTADPFVFTSGRQENPYQYAMWNPLSYVDATGFCVGGGGVSCPDRLAHPSGGTIVDYTGSGGGIQLEAAAPLHTSVNTTAGFDNLLTATEATQFTPRSRPFEWRAEQALYTIGDYASGFGDELTVGTTGWIRSHYAGGDPTDRDSTAYSAGEYTVLATDVLGAGALVRAGVRQLANGARVAQATVARCVAGGDCPCFSGDTLVLLGTGDEAEIKDVRVGDRVMPTNDLCEAQEYDGWMQVSLAVTALDSAGVTHELSVQILRDADDVTQWRVGDTIQTDLSELNLSGPAEVVDIQLADIEQGVGCVVLGTVQHLSTAAVQVELPSEELTVTAAHPLFSSTRGTWVRADSIEPGEHLLTSTGEEVVVGVDRAQQPAQQVYNLHVDYSHRYYVGQSHVLAHNSYLASAIRVGEILRARVPEICRYGQCKQFAYHFAHILRALGVPFKVTRIRPSADLMVAHEVAGVLGERGVSHWVIEVGDVLFDNLHPTGTPANAWWDGLIGDERQHFLIEAATIDDIPSTF